MKIPKRFALSTLLLLMLAVASIFGFAQWRRLWLIREVKELNVIGDVTFAEPASWRRLVPPSTFPPYRSIDPPIRISKGFWPQIETKEAEFNIQKLASERFLIGDEELSRDSAKVYLQGIQNRLENLGIKVNGLNTFDLEKELIRCREPVDLVR